jgi:hypothetical protein
MRTLLLSLVAACGAAHDPVAIEDYGQAHEPWAEPARPVQLEHKSMVDFHMRRHFDDLRGVERLLIAGKLDDAKALAFLLTQPAKDPGMARWEVAGQRVTDAATALVNAPGLDEALRRETRLAAACAACHLAIQRTPKFPAPPAAPPDTGTTAARMARHAWAVDRVWEGMIAPDDTPWRNGLAVLAQAPLPYAATTDAPALAASLQRQARRELDMEEPITMDHRAAAYGEMLVTCAACHTTLRAKAAGH